MASTGLGLPYSSYSTYAVDLPVSTITLSENTEKTRIKEYALNHNIKAPTV